MTTLAYQSVQSRAAPSRMARVGLSVIAPVALLITWELAIRAGWLPSTLIARPTEVVTSAKHLISNGTLFLHAAISLRRLLLGFLAGAIPAILAGTLIGYSR